MEMKKAAGEDEARPRAAWATLLKLVGNVARAPQEDKFRRVKVRAPPLIHSIFSYTHRIRTTCA